MSGAASEASLVGSLRLAILGLLGGIALSVSASPETGGLLTVGSVAWLVWSLHRFGRLGPDPGG